MRNRNWRIRRRWPRDNRESDFLGQSRRCEVLWLSLERGPMASSFQEAGLSTASLCAVLALEHPSRYVYDLVFPYYLLLLWSAAGPLLVR